MGGNELGNVGNRCAGDPESAALLFGSLFSLGNSLSGRAGEPHLVAGRARPGFGVQQTFESNAFPAQMDAPSDLLARGRIVLQSRRQAVQGDQNIPVLVAGPLMQEVSDRLQVELGKSSQFEGGYRAAARFELRDSGSRKAQGMGYGLLAEAACLAMPSAIVVPDLSRSWFLFLPLEVLRRRHRAHSPTSNTQCQ